jgi:predicted metal-dependent peptidase
MSKEIGIQKVQKAVLDVSLDHCFYGGVLLKMDYEPDDTVERFSTDGKKIYFNPLFASTMTPYAIRFIIVHETLHVMLKHHLRKEWRDHEKYNMAADYVIHCLMAADGWKILDWVLYEPKFDNLTTEQVYKRLPDQPQTNGNGGTGTVSGDAPIDGTGKPINCPGEVRELKHEDGTALDDNEKAVESQEIDVAIAQAMNQARSKGEGTLSAAQQRFCKDILDSKVPWFTELRMYLETFARDDYNFSMPNRRYVSYGLYMPSLKSESMPDMVFYIDTSGSVSNQELTQYMSEVAAILQIFDVNIHVIFVDSAFKKHQEFNSKDYWSISEFQPEGGGGTNFKPGFKYVADKGIEPAVAVYLTDLDCHQFPEEEPGYPVIWVCTDPYYYNHNQPPFGKSILAELD